MDRFKFSGVFFCFLVFFTLNAFSHGELIEFYRGQIVQVSLDLDGIRNQLRLEARDGSPIEIIRDEDIVNVLEYIPHSVLGRQEDGEYDSLFLLVTKANGKKGIYVLNPNTGELSTNRKVNMIVNIHYRKTFTFANNFNRMITKHEPYDEFVLPTIQLSKTEMAVYGTSRNRSSIKVFHKSGLNIDFFRSIRKKGRKKPRFNVLLGGETADKTKYIATTSRSGGMYTNRLDVTDIYKEVALPYLKSEEHKKGDLNKKKSTFNNKLRKVPESVSKNFKVHKIDKEMEIEWLLKDKTVKQIRTSLVDMNAMLIGPSGSGKTYLIERFIQGVYLGLFPELSHIDFVLEVNTADLEADTMYIGTLQKKLKSLFDFAEKNNVLLIIDEAFKGAGIGSHSGRSNYSFYQDFLNYWEKEPSKIPTIMMGTPHEMSQAFGSNEPLLRRFVEVIKKPYSTEEILEISRIWAKKKGIIFDSPETIKRALWLSDNYMGIGNQPSKITKLLKKVRGELIVSGEKLNITNQILMEMIPEVLGISKDFFDRELLKERILSSDSYIDKEIIGLDRVRKKIKELNREQFISPYKKGTHNGMKVLLVGPPGTGKTFSGKVYAKSMGLPVEIIAMSELSGRPLDALLGKIAAGIRLNPMTVFVIDELEKAPIAYQNALLNVLNDGEFRTMVSLGAGSSSIAVPVTVDASRSSFFFASNALSRSIGEDFSNAITKSKEDFKVAKESVLNYYTDDVLREKLVKSGMLSEPLVDRFDYIGVSLPPSPQEFRALLEKQVEEQVKSFKIQKNVEITFKNLPSYLDSVMSDFYEVGYSVRYVFRGLQDLRSQIIDKVFQLKNRRKINLDLKMYEKNICVNVLKKTIGF